MHKARKRYIYLIAGMSFWGGFGLSSIINIIKTIYTRQTLSYNWVMLAVAIVFIIICLIYLIKTKKNKPAF